MNESRAEEWQAPLELLCSVPRPVCLTAAGKVVTVLAVMLAAGALSSGVLLYTAATRDQARAARLESEAVTTQAEVVRLGLTRGDHPRRLLTYRYTVDGRFFQGRTTLRSSDRRPFEIGSPLTIRYQNSNPKVSWTPGGLGGVPVWTVAIVPPSLLFPACVLAFLIRKQRWLASEGRVARGRITETRRVHTGEHRGYRVFYEFTDLSGATRTGRFDKNKKPLPVGSALTVVYDPNSPRRSAPYPFALARACH
jgi:hypothetical protein